MSEPLVLLERTEADGRVALCAPRVGVWTGMPAEGSPLSAGSPAGTLRTLGRRHALVVPPGVAGAVAAVGDRDRERAVGYGDVLFHVRPSATRAAAPTSAPAAAGESAAGTQRVLAPTDGVFYTASGPGAAPYAPVGARIRTGDTIGLIEVMKTFNPIPYGGASLPAEASVVAVLASDGEEVRAGQPLLVVE